MVCLNEIYTTGKWLVAFFLWQACIHVRMSLTLFDLRFVRSCRAIHDGFAENCLFCQFNPMFICKTETRFRIFVSRISTYRAPDMAKQGSGMWLKRGKRGQSHCVLGLWIDGGFRLDNISTPIVNTHAHPLSECYPDFRLGLKQLSR